MVIVMRKRYPAVAVKKPELDPGVEAVLFITEGEPTVAIADKVLKLTPGGCAYIPPGRTARWTVLFSRTFRRWHNLLRSHAEGRRDRALAQIRSLRRRVF